MSNGTVSLRPDIVFEPPVDNYVVIYDPKYKKYFRIGEREAVFVDCLRPEFGERAPEAHADFTGEQSKAIVSWLHKNRLLLTDEVGDDDNEGERGGVLGFFQNPSGWRATLLKPDPFLDRFRKIVDGFFSRPAVAIYLIIFLSPAILSILMPDSLVLAVSSFDSMLSVSGWITLYVVMVFSTLLHEMSHAIACKHFGGRVEKIGLMLLYLHPVAYCDVSSSWRFREVHHKIIVSAAGIFFQLLMAALCASLWIATSESIFAYLALLNVAVSLINSCPFVKLDGYWMLVHFLKEPNLRHKSLQAIENQFKKLFNKGNKNLPRNITFITFGLTHIIFIIFFWLLGLSTVFRYTSYLSEVFAWIICGIIMLYTLYRLGKAYFGRYRSGHVGERF